jgi:hypothetical protein
LLFKQDHTTADSAREYLRSVRTYDRPKYPGYTDMPPTITLPGEAIARTVKDALWYAANSKELYWYFRNRLVPKYGMQQITDVLNQK